MSAPPDMTLDFIDRLKTNGKTAVAVGAVTGGFGGDLGSILAKRGAKFAWFYRQVRNGCTSAFADILSTPNTSIGGFGEFRLS